MQIERTDDEINDVLNKCSEQSDAGGSKWPGQTYEDGVAAALRWVTGDDDNNPMED
jgi:hypothetical protein